MKSMNEKPRIATVHRDEDKTKLTLTVPSRYCYRDTVVMSHESLSVLRSWCYANNYKIDESRIQPKPKKEEFDDSEEYTY